MSKAYFAGGGLGALAAAEYCLRMRGMRGCDLFVYETAGDGRMLRLQGPDGLKPRDADKTACARAGKRRLLRGRPSGAAGFAPTRPMQKRAPCGSCCCRNRHFCARCGRSSSPRTSISSGRP